MRQRWLLVVAAAGLILASFAAGLFFSGRSSDTPDKAMVAKLMATPFTDPAGRTATLEPWRGKPMIVNFWATWCPPCLREMPVFSRLQEKHPEVQFVGIAADSPAKVRDFVAENRISYPILVAADGAAQLMQELGNDRNGLPFTLAIDASGQTRQIRIGGLTEAETERMIAGLSSR